MPHSCCNLILLGVISLIWYLIFSTHSDLSNGAFVQTTNGFISAWNCDPCANSVLSLRHRTDPCARAYLAPIQFSSLRCRKNWRHLDPCAMRRIHNATILALNEILAPPFIHEPCAAFAPILTLIRFMSHPKSLRPFTGHPCARLNIHPCAGDHLRYQMEYFWELDQQPWQSHCANNTHDNRCSAWVA